MNLLIIYLFSYLFNYLINYLINYLQICLSETRFRKPHSSCCFRTQDSRNYDPVARAGAASRMLRAHDVPKCGGDGVPVSEKVVFVSDACSCIWLMSLHTVYVDVIIFHAIYLSTYAKHR